MNVRQLAGKSVDHFVRSVGTRLDGSPLAVMLDIDGTLSPIVPRPEHAIVPAATRDTLRKLVALPGVLVALVSGRSAADSWRLAGLAGAWVIGNHGLELRDPDGKLTTPQEVQPFEAAITEAARALGPIERTVPGAIVENKRWTLSLHYRLVDPSATPALMERAGEVAREFGLRMMEGKKIIELRPPVDVNKGTATTALAERVGALRDGGSVMYAGDDRTDEDAFRALRARNRQAVTTRIDTSEADPSEMPTHAEFVLGSPDELRQVLEWLVVRRRA
ncbi:MAG TPA: trehalose-phosphatase [Gemmatimonadaceae bacterium]|jgi:trehalose-phosphatase